MLRIIFQILHGFQQIQIIFLHVLQIFQILCQLFRRDGIIAGICGVTVGGLRKGTCQKAAVAVSVVEAAVIIVVAVIIASIVIAAVIGAVIIAPDAAQAVSACGHDQEIFQTACNV